LPTIGRKRVAVAELLVTLVAAATIRERRSAAMDVDILFITRANCELTHSDKPEDCTTKKTTNTRVDIGSEIQGLVWYMKILAISATWYEIN
jgi:hypothetical protein